MTDYDDARAALFALVPRGIVLGLASVRAALAATGDPQANFQPVHVAGTNGKGSVCAMVEAGLRHDGRRTGLYSSPHLHAYTERFRIDGVPADESLVAREARALLDAIAHGTAPALTFFEATTVLAWHVFARAHVDEVVLEVGLGGRLDATSVCDPSVTAITRIARDHEALLGDTESAIAREKAGILKHGVACVLGPQLRSGEAREAIEAVAREVGAPLVDAPDVHIVRSRPDGRVRIACAGLEADVALPGAHQAGNAGVAIALLEARGVGRAAIVNGLESVRWPARLERIGDVLLDAAHNPDGIAALVAAVESSGAPCALVMGVSADKDWTAMVDAIAPLAPESRRFFTAAGGLKRALAPSVLASHAGGRAVASVIDAVHAARASLAEVGRGTVVVCGSIFVVAEARAALLGVAHEAPVGQ